MPLKSHHRILDPVLKLLFLLAMIVGVGCANDTPAPMPDSKPTPQAGETAPANRASLPESSTSPSTTASTIAKQPETGDPVPATEFVPFVKLWTVDTDEFDYTKGFALANGKAFAVASSKMQFWNIGEDKSNGEIENFDEIVDYSGEVTTMSFSSDGSRLAFGIDNGMAHVWNVATKEVEIQIQAHADGVQSLAFSPDGKHLATSGYDNEVGIWSLADNERVRTFKVDDRSLSSVTYSPDGKQITACGNKVTVWSMATGKVVHEFTNEFEVRNASATYSPNGKTLAIGEMAAQATLLNLETGNPDVTCTGAEGPVDQLIYSTDGRLLITRCGDYTVRIWDPANGSQLQQLDFADDEHTESLAGIAWLAEPGLLVIASETGEVSVWGPEGTPVATAAPEPTIEASGTTTVADLSKDVKPPVGNPRQDKMPNGETSTSQVAMSTDQRHVPAHVIAATDLLDLRKIEWPPGIDGANNNPTALYYNDVGSAEESLRFYDKWFEAQGWTDVTAQTSYGDGRAFEKNGFRVDVGTMTSPPGCLINIRHAGNFDTRWLPMPDDAEDIGSSDFHHAIVVSRKSADELEQLLRQEFFAQGWHLCEYYTHESDIFLTFVSNGMKSSVRLTDSTNYPGKTMLQYGIGMLRDEVPIPEDVKQLEFEDSMGVRFALSTIKDVASTVEFYDRKMKGLRWEPRHNPDEKSGSPTILRFVRDRDTAEISIRLADDGTTGVVGKTTASPTDEYIAAARRADERARERDRRRDNDAIAALEHAIPVAEFPLPESVTDVFRNPYGIGGDIRFKTKSEIATDMQFFRATLVKLQWTEDKHETHERSDFGQLVFRKQKAAIKIRISGSSDDGDGVCSGMIEGTGLVAENDARLDEDEEKRSNEDTPSVDVVDSAAILAMDEMVKQLSSIPGLENVVPPMNYEDWLEEKQLKADSDSMEKYVEEFQAFIEEAISGAGGE